MSTGYVSNPVDAETASFWLFSLNCVICCTHVMGVTQLNSHISSECSGTCDCTNMVARAGSNPAAMYVAAQERVAGRSSEGL